MSITKYTLEQHEDYHHKAVEILISIGEIATCPYHGSIYRKWKYDIKDIYAIATARLKELHPEHKNFPLFCDKIKEIIDCTLDECPDCREN